jgi:hypothetical protein
MKAILVIGLLTISSVSMGQVDTRLLTSDLMRVDEYIKRNDNTSSYTLPKNYKGSPYFNDDFVLGNIYRGDTLISKDIPLRYNIFSNEIEVKETLEQPHEEAKPLTKSSEIYVKINEVLIVLVPLNGKDEDGSYFQVLHEGKKVDLLKRVEIKYTAPKKAKTSITRDLKGVFANKDTYFLQTKNGKMYELPKAKKKKFMVFGNKKEALEQYAKENRLNINKEHDLKRLILHFDNL